MRKIALIALSILCLTQTGVALPVGNPAEPLFIDRCEENCLPSCLDFLTFRVGYYGDFVFERHMERTGNPGKEIEKTTLTTNAGYLAVDFCHLIEVFGILGASRLYIENNPEIFANLGINGRMFFQTETDFSWSLGVRSTPFCWKSFSFGIEAQYFRTNPHLTQGNIFDSQTLYLPNNVRFKYDEWQLGAGLAYCIQNIFYPYLAVKWATAHIDAGNPSLEIFNMPNFESKKQFGFAVGLSVIGCQVAAVTVEGRFADEKALYLNGQIAF